MVKFASIAEAKSAVEVQMYNELCYCKGVD